MKHIKLFENFAGRKKILITLSSAGSSGITSGLRNFQPNEGSSWSIDFPREYDITELCQEIGEKTNDEYTKIIAGLSDLIKFKRDYEGFLDGSIGNKQKLKKKLENIIQDELPFARKGNINKLLIGTKFRKLNIDDKIIFYNDFIDMGFLVVRGSYIYKVIDENEFDSLCNEISFRLDTLE